MNILATFSLEMWEFNIFLKKYWILTIFSLNWDKVRMLIVQI